MISLPSASSSLRMLGVALCIPAVGIAASLVYIKISTRPHIAVSSGKRLPGSHSSPGLEAEPIRRPISLPPEVDAAASEYLLAYERVVSVPQSLPNLGPRLKGHEGSDTVALTTYIRAAMTAFSWTPQALAIRAALRNEADRQTFDKSWIDRLQFKEGEQVDGVYRVVHRSVSDGGPGDRVELMLEPPASYHGPVVKGLIVAAIEVLTTDDDINNVSHSRVRFVNETWLWRSVNDSPLILEYAVGRWLHSLLAGWLITKGLAALREECRSKSSIQ